MADQPPSTTPFQLPDDVHVLAHLRDQLGDYLSTLERNTDSIRDWLSEQQNNIIVGHHRLVRAIEMDRDEKKALDVLKKLGDTAGFILNLQDFGALARARFGDNSALEKALAAVPRGVPADILEDLPAVRVPKANDTVEAIGLQTRIEIPPLPDDGQKKGFWSSLGGMFKGQDPEEEARRKEEAVKRHWRQLRGELISLQSDRHYYIDSFMDWVGENLEPADIDAPTASLMQQYESPQYVINLAQRDYDEVNTERTRRLNAQALEYSSLAHKLDTQDIKGFIAQMPALFPRHETPESKRSKELLLTDFGVASFAELALTHVKKDADRIALLSAALSYEPNFKIAGLQSGAQIFERVLGEVLKPEPLNPEALEITLKKLRGREDGTNLLPLANTTQTPFYRIAARFDGDHVRIGQTSEKILTGLGMQDAVVSKHVAAFAAAADNGDAQAMLNTLRDISARRTGHAFMALWALTYPQESIMDKLPASGAAPKMLSLLTSAAIEAGVHDEWNVGGSAVKSNAPARSEYGAAIRFIDEHIMPSLSGPEQFDVQTARLVLATAFLNGGLDALRPQLTAPGGWLEQIAASDSLKDKDKLAWLAALVEPYNSDIVRANILHAAADQAEDKQAARLLSAIESIFVSDNVRLDSERMLTNLGRIANIWYNPEPKTLRFTISGVGQLLQENVSQHMADETLALLQRKGGFEAEYDGLINAANIDRIVTTQSGTKIAWHRHTADFNGTEAQAAALHRRADFMHEDDPKTGETFSINQKSILLLQPLEDGTHLLVDRYGAAHVLEGNIRLEAQPPLLNLGGVWFNPHAASIISLSSDKKSLEFRAESREFDDFLEVAAGEDEHGNPQEAKYLYSVPLPGSNAGKAVADVIANDTGFAAPVGGADTLVLNLRALGYLKYEDDDVKGDAGFYCHKYGPTRKPGFVHPEDAEFAEALYKGLKTAPDVINVGKHFAHKSMIEDAYFNAENNTFYMVIGQEVHSTPAKPEEAYAALKKLSGEKGFEVVGTNLVDNPVKGGIGQEEVPADVINLSRASLIAYSAAQDHTYIHTDQDKYHINLNRSWAQDLFKRLEKEGRAPALKNAQKIQGAADFESILSLSSSFDVVAKPALGSDAPAYLLAQAMGEGKEVRRIGTIDKDFSVASAAVNSGQKIKYPRQRQPQAAANTEMPASRLSESRYRPKL